jgi:hypothetical protein
MDGLWPIFLLSDVLALIMVLVGFYLSQGWCDQRRIRRHFDLQGGHVLSIKRRIPGYWSEWSSRVYEVASCDINGHEHIACYRTGFWLGTWKYSPLSELRGGT